MFITELFHTMSMTVLFMVDMNVSIPLGGTDDRQNSEHMQKNTLCFLKETYL